MNLLAFETATEACSVALAVDGAIVERYAIAPRRHAELALPWADALLAEAGLARTQLDAIAVGRGPGAFTGVRLAIAIAQGVALGLDRPIVPVSTLAALALPAARAHPGETVLAAIDARMGELYVGAYAWAGERLDVLANEALVAPDSVEIDAPRLHGVGTGFGAQDGLLATRFADRLATLDAAALPHAADVARIAMALHAEGAAVAAEHVEPAYLRNDVALTLVQQQAARAART